MVERFEELWRISLEGNWKEEFSQLQKTVDKSRRDWNKLRDTFAAAGAEFKKPARALKDLKGAARDSAVAANKLRAENVDLADSGKVLGQAISGLVTEQNRLNVSRAKNLTALDQQKRGQKPLIVQIRAEERAIRTVAKALEDELFSRELSKRAKEAGLQASADGTRLFNAEAEALEKIAKAAERAAVAEELRKRGFGADGRELQIAQGPATRDGTSAQSQFDAQAAAAADLAKLQQQNLRKEINLSNKEFVDAKKKAAALEASMRALSATGEKTDSVFNRVGFTFRRLIGIMAAFTVARVVTREFVRMITTAIRFQAEIESTRVGLSGLIAASAEIRSPQGRALGIDDQLLLSQQIAIDQMNKLRVDALRTAASYDELARAFQNAIAPGIQSGLTLDQIRKVTVNISQAATGLGLAQDQLAEEIRSLFTGAISSRNTRIATALGITPADIERARRLGTLFEFLDTRFKAISKTGKLLMNTFTGQLSNAADAFKQLLATSSTPLFEQLKQGLADFQGAIFTSVNDSVKLDPQTLAAFRDLFSGLANGVAAVRNAFSNLNLGGLGDILGSIGQVLGLAAAGIANAIVLISNAAAPTVTVFKLLVGTATKLFSVVTSLLSPFKGVLGFVGGIGIKAVVAFVVLKKLLGITTLLQKGWGKLNRLFLSSIAITDSMPSGLRAVNTVVQKIFLNFKKFLVVLATIASVLLIIDSIMKALGAKTSVFDVISDVLGSVTDKIEDALLGTKGLKEELAGDPITPFGLVATDFRKLKGELVDVGLEIRKGIRSAAAELKIAIDAIGIPSAIADQFGVSRQIRNDTEQDDKVVELQNALEEVRIRLNDAEKAKAKELGARATTLQYDIDNAAAEVARAGEALFRFKAAIQERLQVDSATLEAELRGRLKDYDSPFSGKRIGFEFETLTDAVLKAQNALNSLYDLDGRTSAPVRVLTSQLKGLTDELANLRLEAETKARVGFAGKAIADSFNALSSKNSLETEAAAIQASSAALRQRETLQASLAAKIAEAGKVSIDALEQETDLIKGIQKLERRLAADRLAARSNNPRFDQAVFNAQQLQIDQRKSELEFLKLANAERVKAAALEARLADLQANGSFAEGFGQGLNKFAEQNDSLFAIGENAALGFANGIADLGGQAIAAIFDPTSNFDLREAAGKLALQLGQELATEVLKNALAQGIQAIGIDVVGDLSTETAKATIVTTAYSAARDALITGAAAVSAAAVQLLNAAGVLSAQQGTQAALSASSSLYSAGLAKGGRAGSGARFRTSAAAHARAQGFSRGGRPLGMDHRDTIPAWLRPGDGDIRPEAVSHYGESLFDLLNRRRLNPAALAGVASLSGPRVRSAPGRRSFATGGNVPASRSRTPTPVVLAQYHDEQTMDRALAAGPDSMVRFARTKRSAYRAALGIGGG